MNYRRRQLCTAAAASIAATLGNGVAMAQQFKPARPVRILVPYLPGGVPDIVSRQIAKELTSLWNQPVIVENKPGAAGGIATEYLARSAGDGLTFMVADDGALVSAPLLKAKLSYDPLVDVVPIGTVGASPYVIVGPPNSPSLGELFAKARANPGAVDYASNGVGGPHHLVWEQWQEDLRLKLTQVPYNGTLPALQDVSAGLVALMAATPSSAQSLLQAGRVKALAAVSKERFRFLPDLPTTVELGFPEMQGEAWYGMMAPGSMSRDLVEKIGADLRRVLQSKEFAISLEDRNNLPLVLNSKQTLERINKQRARAMALFKRIGLKPA